jgi:hypothetical protein
VQHRLRVVERLLRHELAFVQLLGAGVRLPGLHQLGLCLLDVRCLLDRRQVSRVGRAVLRQCASERRFLLVEVILGLLAIELNEHLAHADAVAEVGQNPAHRAFGL